MKITNLLIIGYVTLATTSCNGIFDNIYDKLPQGSESNEGFSIIPSNPNQIILTIDASDFDVWTYVSLKNMTLEKFAIPLTCEGQWDGYSAIAYQEVKGDKFTILKTIPTDVQHEPAEWDFAIHRFDVRTHNGAVARTNLRNIEDVYTLNLDDLEFEPDTWSES